jgi:uncharacterized protein (TIGR03000 family)
MLHRMNAIRLVRLLALGALLVSLAGVTSSAPRAQQPRPAQPQVEPGRIASRLVVTVPQPDTELAVDGEPVEGEGTTRQVDTRPSPPGLPQTLTLTATWKPNGYTTMTRSKVVTFRAGETLPVDISVDDPGDRVRVIYVPTPADIAEEMVKLAAVTSRDVVYEPGCGDARITIAAMRAGARRAICVDIDKERADESRENVRAAGMENRIDVRHGDALEVRDLKDVTVVLLYMGDHFNMLVRPVLWRELPVGARIVSHRFTMGDWEPERTVTIDSAEGGQYELHLWTITPELKRRASGR